MRVSIVKGDPGHRWNAKNFTIHFNGELATHVVTAGANGARLELGIEWRGLLARPVALLAARRTARMIELEARTFARLAEQG